MPSVPVRARLLVLGATFLCGERMVTVRFLLSVGILSGKAHSVCRLLSCILLTPAAVHSPCVDGLHGHGNADSRLSRIWAVLLQYWLNSLYCCSMPATCLLATENTSIAVLEIYVIG